MRRADREVKKFEDIIAIMEECDVCRIALNDDGCPYILPLNFGMRVRGDQIELYFHGALQGKKYDLIEKDNRAGFEMDCAHKLVIDESRGYCTMAYKSVIGRGRIEMLQESEKPDALRVLMKHYHKEDFAFDKAATPQTRVFKLTVESVSGKQRIKKGEGE